MRVETQNEDREGRLFSFLLFNGSCSIGDFVYTDLAVSPDNAGEDGNFTVGVTLTNRGSHTASETLFLFSRDRLASVSRPLLELKGFDRVALKPGESGRVTFRLAARDLRFPGADLEPLFEPGEITLLVGPSADPARQLSVAVRLT